MGYKFIYYLRQINWYFFKEPEALGEGSESSGSSIYNPEK